MNQNINPKLMWLCRRGMKELDEILQPYLKQNYQNASPKEQQAFEKLLHYQDPEIIDRIFYGKSDADADVESLLQVLRQR